MSDSAAIEALRNVPPQAATVLRSVLPSLSARIIEAIGRDVPAYALPLEGDFGRALRTGVERALGRFVDMLDEPSVRSERWRLIYVELGRGEVRQGRSLDALQTAYRVGARLAWRGFVDAGVAGNLAPDVLYSVGEAMFAYIDELSAASIEGYADEQSTLANERQRRRDIVVALLMQEPSATSSAIQEAAAAAGWQAPASVAALAADGEEPGRIGTALGPDAVAAALDGVTVALVGDPDAPGRRATIARAVGGRAAALGPTVELHDAALSAAWARRALLAAANGAIPGGDLVIAEEHLATLLLSAEPRLARALAERSLAALESLDPRTRERLSATLRAWLDHLGRVDQVARALGVHAQTVRYRMAQLRDLLGSSLDLPERRFELSLALRAPEDARVSVPRAQRVTSAERPGEARQ